MSSYQKTLLVFNAIYYRNVSEGKTQPFLVPRDLAGKLLMFVWVMLTPHPASLPSISRPAAFATLVALSIWTLIGCPSLGLAFGFDIGAQSVMTVVLAINFMFLHDPRQFSRLVLKRRVGARVQAQPCIQGLSGADLTATTCDTRERQFIQDYDVVRQKIPDNLFSRAGWVLDLLISLRGSHSLALDRHSYVAAPIQHMGFCEAAAHSISCHPQRLHAHRFVHVS